MAFAGDKSFYDRVCETSTTTGTGSITMAGASSGCRTFAAAVATNAHFDYTIEGVTVPTEYETGHGIWNGSVLQRTVVHTSSNSNALVNFSAGTKNVYATVNNASLANLQPFVNVDDCGCVGDGTTDDTVAFQAALDTGAMRVIATKTYLITDTLQLQPYQILTGPPRALLVDVATGPRIKFRPGSSNKVCIKNEAAALGNGVEDMTFDMNDSTNTVIQFNATYSNVVRRCWFFGTFNIGVLLHDTYVCNLEDLIFNGSTVKSFCIYVSAASNAVTIRRLHTSGLPYDNAVCLYGIGIDGGYAHTISDCVIQGATIGIATGTGTSGVLIDNPYFENTVCNIRLGNSGAGPSGSSYVVRGGVLGGPYASHPQYAKRGPVCYLMCGKATFDGVNIQSTADNTSARGPWPFVLSEYCDYLQFNNPTHFSGTTRNLFYREASGASPHLTIIGGQSANGTEIILKDTDNYGTNCHGISVNAAGTISSSAYQPAVIFAAVDSILKTALPVGATLII